MKPRFLSIIGLLMLAVFSIVAGTALMYRNRVDFERSQAAQFESVSSMAQTSDNTASYIKISSPVPGSTLSDNVGIVINAKYNKGIDYLELFVDGKSAQAMDMTDNTTRIEDYSAFILDTKNYSNGDHNLSVHLVSSSQVITFDEISISISN